MEGFRIEAHAVVAAQDMADAEDRYARWIRLGRQLGLICEGASIERMRPDDVVPDSPLAAGLCERH